MSLAYEDWCRTPDDVRTAAKRVRDRRQRLFCVAAPKAMSEADIINVAAVESGKPIEIPQPKPKNPKLTRAQKIEEALRISISGEVPAKVVDIRNAVCAALNMQVSEISSVSRARTVTVPRQVAMAICRHLTRASTIVIGKLFGGRDHTTVIHAAKRYATIIAEVEAEIGIDAPIADWISRAITKAIAAEPPSIQRQIARYRLVRAGDDV